MSGRVILLGADGFIGRHVAIELRKRGYAPLCVARSVAALDAMGFATLRVDLQDPASHDPGFWQDSARDAVAAINAAGLLSGSPDAMRAVHEDAPRALYAALPKTAAIVLISATGIGADTAFAEHRRRGEDVARAAHVRLSVLRAGLVLGDTSYGGSSVLRGLAAMPLRIPVVGNGDQPFDPIHATDLARLAVSRIDAAGQDTPIPVGGRDRVSQADMLRALRGWMGLRAVPLLCLPIPLAGALGRIGDAMRLGPISSAALAQLRHGVLTARENRIELPGLSEFLPNRPAGTQDLWHARLYLLRPAVRLVLALLWLVSGLLGLLLPVETVMQAIGGTLPETPALILARGAGLVDLAIAGALLRGWRLRQVFVVQITVVLGYTVVIGALNPALWLDPYGALLKNLPIVMLLLVHRILEQER